MNFKGLAAAQEDASGRIWHFADCEFDELGRELRVRGRRVEVEGKPLELLLQLLIHAGEVVTKDELLEAIWPDVMVVDGSLATAVSKLRKAIGAEDHSVIVTVPRTGYRLAVPVHCKVVAAPGGQELGLRTGDMVPGREMWRLERAMSSAGSSEVWLARNPKTREQRVFKFAADSVRLKALKREITVSRFLKESLGERPEFVRILEWNLTTPPFFLESEYVGIQFGEWATTQMEAGGLPLEERLKLMMEIVQTVAAAHSVGVLHKDLKPANILVEKGASGGWQIKIADFGSASLHDPVRLAKLGITNLGFTHTVRQEDQPITGTLMYLAPEVLAGQSPSTGSDIYALGVLLYQLVIGDFKKPVVPGWEDDVEDPLLREDIAAAAYGDPARRLTSANELYERLNMLEQRRIQRNELETAHERARVAEKKLAEAHARRPWMLAATALLLLGMGVSIALYRRAVNERDRAARETNIATTINRFLAQDLLGRGNPFAGGKADESFIGVMKQASPQIDRQFRYEPLIAGHLHQSIAEALDARTDYPDARKEYEHAAMLYRSADGPASQDAIVVELQRASMEARSYESGTLPLAKTILAKQETMIARLKRPRPEVAVWDDSARGMIALIGNHAHAAAANFQDAVERSNALPQFDPQARLNMQQRLAFCYIRMGDGAHAEQLFHQLIRSFTALSGADSPSVLRVRLNLAQAYMIENKNKEAVEETTAIYPKFVALLGEDHELTMQVLTTRAQSEGSLGLWNDSTRDDLKVHALAVHKHGPLSLFAVATLSDAALAQCRGGQLSAGLGNAQKAYAASLKAFGAKAGLTGGAAMTTASCLIRLNRLQRADALLKQVNVPAVAQLVGDPDIGAEVMLQEAQIAFRKGNYRVARSDIEQVRTVFTKGNAEPYKKHEFAQLRAELDAPPIKR